MELIALWDLFKRRWWLMALPAAVALIVTLPALRNVLSPPVSYLVQVRLTAAAPPNAGIEGVTTPYEDTAYVPWLASEYVVTNMPPWIASDSFAGEVRAVLDERGVSIDGDLNGAFIADGFRSVLTLYVVRDDPDEIRPIAEAAIRVLQTRSHLYFPQAAAGPLQVQPLDDIEVSELAPPITARLSPLIRIFVGLAAGIGLALLAEYLDDGLRSRAEIEALGLPVLAEIPRER